MGSFKGLGRIQGRVHRRGVKGQRFGFLQIESLEGRRTACGAADHLRSGAGPEHHHPQQRHGNRGG